MKKIKRYPNRKLYDTEESRYITLEEIAAYMRGGGEVVVVDSKTGRDITSVTLAQVLLGEEKRRGSDLSIQKVKEILQSGGEFLQKTLGSNVSTLRDEAERTVHRLIKGGQAEEIREFILTTQKAYDEVQRRMDERLQLMLAAVRNISPLQKDMESLKREVADLAKRVKALEAGADRGSKARDGAGGALPPEEPEE